MSTETDLPPAEDEKKKTTGTDGHYEGNGTTTGDGTNGQPEGNGPKPTP